ncbi:AMP-binding protein [Pseudorhodobacter sp.]|uniref:AMP-binding protein n=1 Tax=Pseudorhodobacter sp. TaxID=1934400 RepID=UPI00264979E0|nr:AMP-binding protein [Pseudorhodobacter sp.]MDN5786901.1 AMP-binding protein [Pseudorhodobacter sp.]
MVSLLADFAAAVLRHPDRVAIVDGKGRETSFAQLETRAEGFARAWQARGVGKGDRVLLAMPLDADLYASLAALWSLGATVVLPEPAMGLAGLRHAAKVAEATAFCSAGVFGVLQFLLPELWRLRRLRPNVSAGKRLDLPAPQDGDIALISFTSGTSGAPKAIPRSHGFLSAQHQAIAPMLQSAAAERDLVAFPVFVLINIASGQTSVLPSWKMSKLERLAPEVLAGWIKQQNVNRALIPPALCEKLVRAGVPANLHTVFTGGGPVFPDILEKLAADRPGLSIVCVYGSTEAEPIAHLDAAEIEPKDHAQMVAGQGLLVGAPVPGLQVRIVGDEIQVAGAHVNGGYLDPRHDAENKIHEGDIIWHRTGDAGRFDDQGRLWLLGRTGSQVPLAGGPVYPFAIEVAVHSWAGVTQCAVMSVGKTACLVIEGDARHLPEWRQKAIGMGIPDVRHLTKIPMDRRHASKIDRKALGRLLAS